ncbi:hypothetical protein HHX47_DHR3001121 [Lentinula edodes]|nr:hypothetical protein HHX47_DHR3001121 [Lentinula edodes]
MDIFDDFPNVEQIVAASEFFCQHLKSRKGFEPSLELCLTALTVDLDLHEKLKSAHDARDLAALERLCGAGDFVLAIDDLESNRDWTGHLPFRSSPRYTANLQNNIKTVFRLNSEALLARLLVFKMYLEACSKEGFRHYHRRRWLESQIFPHTLASSFEPYGKLKREIARAEVDDSVIDEAITRTLEDIQRIWHISPGEFFYVVIDEANVGCQKHGGAFEDEYGRYPLLKEIIRSLQRRMGHLPVRFVVAGTIIPREHFQSSSGEWDSFHWCSDTGCFDDPENHRRYISEFLPPQFEKSDTGQLLIHRIWHWLRGSFLTTSKGCLDIPGNDIALINEDYGIFLDTMCSRIGLDEPATVAYGANWFKQNPYFTLVKLAGTFAWNYATEIHPSHFALSLALSLALCYADFSKISDTCTLFGLSASLSDGRLVKFVKVAEQLEALDVQFSKNTPDRLVFLAGAPEEVVSWFRHERDEPFCVLPSSSSTGPEVLTLLDQLPNLNTDVGPSGILRISGSFWVKSATANSIPREEYPAGVLNIEGLDKVTKEVSQDMLMRRLSRIFTQGERMEASHMALPAVARGDVSVKKRGRSTSTADGTALTSKADGTKVQKSSKGIVTGSGSMTRKSRKGTRSLRTRRSNGNMRDVVTGRASVVVPRTSLVDSTVPSSSSVSPYNLRKRK